MSFYTHAEENNLPFSYGSNLPDIDSFVEMERFDKDEFLSESKNVSGGIKRSRFAKMILTDIRPENSGEWWDTDQGMIWRVAIRSTDAYSLYCTLDTFNLKDGVRMFVYAPGYNSLRGGFTSDNNNRSNILSVSPVRGEVLIVELNIPEGVHDYGKLVIKKVYHDCLDIFSMANPTNQRLINSLNCFENINCENGKYWQTEKRAVCKIITDGELSTGVLIGNTTGDNTPYILTVNHTIYDESQAAQSLFIFNYEYQECNSTYITYDHTLSGASLIATSSNLDFSLVRLDNVPPLYFNSYYAGWDKRATPPQKGTCIHHPLGSVKQIAHEYHPLTTADIGMDYDENAFWNVSHWEIGTTQPGSSGSPLFNQDHRLVGSLTGGRATCDQPVDDYFNKIALAFDRYQNDNEKLSVWLDPEGKGNEYIDGYDPYGFNNNNCDTTWNTSIEDPELSSEGLNWGWITGHNSAGSTAFAEKFISPSSMQIPGFFINAAKVHYGHPLSAIVVKVWEGSDTPESEIYTQQVFLNTLIPNFVNYIGFDSVVMTTGNFFIGYEINYSDSQDTFAVYHSSAHYPVSTFFVHDGSWKNIYKASNLYTSLHIGIIDCYGTVYQPKPDFVMVYPNPCTNYLNLDLPADRTVYDIECCDLTGRRVSADILFSEEANKVYFNLSPGIYLMKVSTGKGPLFARFLVSAY